MREKPEKLIKLINAKAFCFALVLITALSSTSFGQSITWQRIINGPYQTSNEYGYASCRADGDNIYILGSISNGQIYLLKLNSLGDTIWTKIVSTAYSRGNTIAESDSGSCVLSGEIQNGEAFSIKVDRMGNTKWQKYYGGNLVQIYDIKRSIDGGYLLCGSSYPLNAIVLKIDSKGDLQWSKIFTAGYKIIFQSLIETDQKNVILTGWRAESSSLPTKGLIFKVDAAGNFIWDTTFIFNSNPTGARKIIRINKGYAICGEISGDKLFFLKTNENGCIVFSNVFTSSVYKYYDIGGFIMINSNQFIMNFSQDSLSFPINGKIIIFDSLGVENKSKIFRCIRQISFGSVTQLDDTGFIFCGTIDNNTSSGRDIYIIKCDTALNSNPPLGINNQQNLLPTIVNIKSFPNPFNQTTTIRYEIPLLKDVDAIGGRGVSVTIKIYDLLGREVFSDSEYKQAGSYEVMFDGSNLASGLYYYSIKAETSQRDVYTETKKMVLIK